ncbi:MAG: hypothetical protein NWE93_06160 [Candidatus Bathyarchaeota archaeon]|nr:hypothetical protein [Candidatus Bathyarchaeota archaeon]
MWLFRAQAAGPSGYQTVDSTYGVGYYASLAMDSQGNPAISYYDAVNQDVKYAHWNNQSWDIQTVDSPGFTGLFTSLVFDSNDNPQISFYGQNALKYAKWTGNLWNPWDIEVVDVSGNFSSLALDSNGNPCISYYSAQTCDLKLARWTGSEWNLTTIDSLGDVGQFTSLKVAANGTAYISYYDVTNGNLKFASQNRTGGLRIQTVDNSSANVGQYSSLAMDKNGTAYIAYYDATNRQLKYAKSTPTGWNIQVVDSGNVGADCSVAVDNLGNVHFTYTDNSTAHTLRYSIQYANSTWLRGMSFLLAGSLAEYTNGPLAFTSLRVDADGKALHVAYHDYIEKDLKYFTFTVSFGSGGDLSVVRPDISLAVNPNPDVVNNSVIVTINMPAPPATYSFTGIHLIIGYPNGSFANLGPYSTSTGAVAPISFTPREIGVYTLQATYSPGQVFVVNNSNFYYLPSASSLVYLNVTDVPPTEVNTTLALSVTPNPDMVNQTVTINMAVTPTPPAGNTYSGILLQITCPNGTVAYPYGPFNSSGSGAVPPISFTPTQVGTYLLQAFFPSQQFKSGNNSTLYMPSASNIVPLNVIDGTTTMTLDVTPNPDVINQPAAFTITVSPSPPASEVFTGITLQVTYPNGTITNQSLASNNAGITLGIFTPPETGTYILQAFFEGQAFTSVTYAKASSNIVTLQVTNATEPTPTPSPAPGGSSGDSSSSSSSSSSKATTLTTPTPTPAPEEEDPTPIETPTPEPTQRKVFLDGPYALAQVVLIAVVLFFVCLGVMIVLKRWE